MVAPFVPLRYYVASPYEASAPSSVTLHNGAIRAVSVLARRGGIPSGVHIFVSTFPFLPLQSLTCLRNDICVLLEVKN
jgi:hypothetical protein